MSVTAPPNEISAAATELSVRGMTCQNCARHVREAMGSVPGVFAVSVNLEQQSATVRWTTGATPDAAAVVRAITAAGFEAEVVERRASSVERRSDWFTGWALNLTVGVPIVLFVASGEWLFGLAMERWFQWLAFALATVVQIVCGARFYRGAWRQQR